ncbi:MAG: hypothetical protein R8G66_28880 [Cytophagales bacterium]|nr:hypothetical protein [Cytophagales bacterium]
MKKQTFTLLIIALVTHFPIACVTDPGNSSLGTRITEVIAQVGRYTSSEFDFSISTQYEEAAIRISVSEVDYFEISQSHGNSFSLVNVAQAREPALPEPTQSIESLKITADQPIYTGGNTFNSGDDLAGMFKATGRFLNEGTIDQFIDRQNNDPWIFGEVGSQIIFQLLDQPDSTINQNFTFTFDFSDGEVIEVQSPIFQVEN